MGAINGFIADGPFNGQPKALTDLLIRMAKEADVAQREV